MIKSMTGFGQGEAANEHYKVSVEVKSVNHRYLDLFFRLPRQYGRLEEGLRGGEIQGRLSRGGGWKLASMWRTSEKKSELLKLTRGGFWPVICKRLT